MAVRDTLLSARDFEPSAVDQKPAGDNAQTAAARPRLASSRATNPPAELRPVWPLETVLVEILFGRVDYIPDRDRTALYRRPAAMTESVGVNTWW